MSMVEKFVRLYFVRHFEHITKEGAKLVYRAGEFYHASLADAEELLALGVAKTEKMLEDEAAGEHADAAADHAKAEAESVDMTPQISAE